MSKQQKATKIKAEFTIGKTIKWSDINSHAISTTERNCPNKPLFWAAIVSNYKNHMDMKSDLISTSANCGGYLIDFSKVKINDVVRIRKYPKHSGSYTDRFEIYAVVSRIDIYGVELIICNSLYRAILEQKKIKSLTVTPEITTEVNFQNQGEIQAKRNTNTIKNKQRTKLKELPEDFVLIEKLSNEPGFSKKYSLHKVIDSMTHTDTNLVFYVDTKKEAIALALCEIVKFNKRRKRFTEYKEIKKYMKPLSELEIEIKWSKNPKIYKFINEISRSYFMITY